MPLADFVTREIVDAVTMFGRTELPPCPGVEYSAFCDPVAFDPEVAVAECTHVLKRFGITRVVGDRYAGEWPRARFAEHGIAFEQSARPKSDLYHDLLPLLNAKRVELLDRPRLSAQLVGLERRTARSGRDSVQSQSWRPRRYCKRCRGRVGQSLDLGRRPGLVRQSDLLENDAAAD